MIIHPFYHFTLILIRTILLSFILLKIFPLSSIFDDILGFLHLDYAVAHYIGIFLIIGVVTKCIQYVWQYIYKNISYEMGDNFILEKRILVGRYTKEIKFSQIKEIILKQGILQSKFGVGNIIIHTQASSNKQDKGMTMIDIENAEKIYQLLKSKTS